MLVYGNVFRACLARGACRSRPAPPSFRISLLLVPEVQNVSKRVLEGLTLPEPGCSNLFYGNRETGALAPLHCGTLKCPNCGPGVRRAIAEGIRGAMKIHALDHLWTFTMSGRD